MQRQENYVSGGYVSIWIGDRLDDDQLDDYLNLSRQFESDFDFELNERDMPETSVEESPTSIRDMLAGFSWAEQYADDVVEAASKKSIFKCTSMVIFFNLRYIPTDYIANLKTPLKFLCAVRFGTRTS